MGRLITVALTLCFVSLFVAADAPLVSAQSIEVQGGKTPALSATHFPPMRAWKAAILAGDKAKLVAMYRAAPPANLEMSGGKILTVQEDIAFWAALKRAGFTSASIRVARFEATIPRVVELAYDVRFTSLASDKPERRYVSVWQYWVEGRGQWQIAESLRTGLTRQRHLGLVHDDLYPASASPQSDIALALARAAKAHKHILVVFGANWCFLCHVLDAEFRLPRIARVLSANYEIVHVDLGELNKNLDIADRYGLSGEKGIPDVAILGSNGKLLFSQSNLSYTQATWPFGPHGLLALLNRWRSNPGS